MPYQVELAPRKQNHTHFLQKRMSLSQLKNRKKAKDASELVKEIEEDSPGIQRSHSHHKRHRDAQKNRELKRKLYQSRRVIFILGAIVGLVATGIITALSSDDIKSELDRLISYDSLNVMFEDIKELIPTGMKQMLDFDGQLKKNELHGSAESFSVGKRMLRLHNLTYEHNVVLVPGVISTGLELWSVVDEGDCPLTPHFRKRLWGSFYMLRTMILDKTCWLKHIKLDPETGLDPENIRVRASLGFDAADFFVAGYWIWNKILQNLAVIGYGPNNMLSAAYDWRLAYLDLERRDGYFSKLKLSIEASKKHTGKKTYLVGHSMGSQVILYFMKWVEASGPVYGNGGSSWCNDNLAGFIDISGSLLGTPKAISALISGEMKDTVQLNQLAVYGLEKFFSRKERVDMLRTFGGVPSMIPKGGEVIWGGHSDAPDDPVNSLITDVSDRNLEGTSEGTFGAFIRYKSGPGSDDVKNFTVSESIELLLEQSPDWFSNRVKEQYSFGVAPTAEELKKNNNDHSKWSNPLEVELPNAPDMEIYCFYGVGNPTERAYAYRDDKDLGLNSVIDADDKHPVLFGDGDGTVSLMTHAICHEWKKPESRFNPSNIRVKIVEIKHEPDRFDIRGGAKTAEHVDILGSAELNELVLTVAGGRGSTINDTYYSDLRDIMSRITI